MGKPLIKGGYTPDWGVVTGGLVSGEFRAAGTSNEILAKDVDVSIGGTFSATINVERFIGGDWRTIETITANAERFIENRKPHKIRLKCITFVSGVVDYAMES